LIRCEIITGAYTNRQKNDSKGKLRKVKSFKHVTLGAITAALIAAPALAPAQTPPATSTAPHLKTVTGAIARIGAGVVVLSSGQTIYVNSGTKVIGSMPTAASVIIAKGIPGDQGSITAVTIQIKK